MKKTNVAKKIVEEKSWAKNVIASFDCTEDKDIASKTNTEFHIVFLDNSGKKSFMIYYNPFMYGPTRFMSDVYNNSFNIPNIENTLKINGFSIEKFRNICIECFESI